MSEMIRAIVAKPGEPAEAKDIDGSLKGLQNLVGGLIEPIYPWADQAALVCNDEGKIHGMAPNRALRDDDGKIYDIVCGPMIIVGLSEDSFASLTPEQEKKYLAMFQYPERFMMKDGKISAEPITGKPTFEEFRGMIIRDLSDAVPDKKLHFQAAHITKPDGGYEGVSITHRDHPSVKMSLDLETAYEQLDRAGYDKVLAQITKSVTDGVKNLSNVKTQQFTDYDFVKNHLAIDLVSSHRNEEFLAKVPSTPIVADLTAVYRIQIDDQSSVMITNDMMKGYDVSIEQLHKNAVDYAEKNYPLHITPLSELIGIPSQPDTPPIYVCMAEDKSAFGAGVLAYDCFNKEASEKIGGDFYVLPSSKHELLIINAEGVDHRHLEAMVHDINSTVVDPKDFLSDTVLHYDSQAKKLEPAAEFAARKSQVAEKSAAYEAPKRRGR